MQQGMTLCRLSRQVYISVDKSLNVKSQGLEHVFVMSAVESRALSTRAVPSGAPHCGGGGPFPHRLNKLSADLGFLRHSG